MNKLIVEKLLSDPTAYLLYGYIYSHEQNGKCVIVLSSAARKLKINRQTVQSAINRLISHHKVIIKTSSTGILEFRLLESSVVVPLNTANIKPSLNHHKGGLEKEQEESSKEEQEKEKRLYTERVAVDATAPLSKFFKTREYLEQLPETEILELISSYKVNRDDIKNKAEALLNWVDIHGKRPKNYRALLKNALLKDFGRRHTDLYNGMEVIRSSAYAKVN
jgi:hypothetical protein